MLVVIGWASAQQDPELLYRVVKPYLGVRYVWGGNDPRLGIDCSAFSQQVYRYLGYSLPRTSREQFAALPKVSGSLLPGDLLFFSENGQHITHVAIFLWVSGGKPYMVHSAASRGGVVVEPFAGSWLRIYWGARRLPPRFVAAR